MLDSFAEKLPQTLLQSVVAFFRAVYERHRSEAIVLIFYAPGAPAGQRWRTVAPSQMVTGSHCDYDDPGPAPTGWFLAGTIHSHGGMGAFHSGTDQSDEEMRDGIHITVGNISSLPSYSCSAVVEGTRFPLELADMVEGIAPIAFPSEWLEQVSTPTPPPPATVVGGFGRSSLVEEGDLATHRAASTVVRPAPKKKGGGRRGGGK